MCLLNSGLFTHPVVTEEETVTILSGACVYLMKLFTHCRHTAAFGLWNVEYSTLFIYCKKLVYKTFQRGMKISAETKAGKKMINMSLLKGNNVCLQPGQIRKIILTHFIGRSVNKTAYKTAVKWP